MSWCSYLETCKMVAVKILLDKYEGVIEMFRKLKERLMIVLTIVYVITMVLMIMTTFIYLVYNKEISNYCLKHIYTRIRKNNFCTKYSNNLYVFCV